MEHSPSRRVAAPIGVVTSSRWKWVVALLGVILSGLLLASSPTAQESDPTSALPDGYDSTEVSAVLDEVPGDAIAPAIVVFDRGGDGGELDREQLAFVQQRAQELQPLSGTDARLAAVPSPDGSAAIVPVPLDTEVGDDELADVVGQLREDAAADLPDGMRALVTGGPAFKVDIGAVFDGADVTLLLATAAVVAVLLLITYRSPLLWLVPLTVVGAADQVAARLVDFASGWLGFGVDGSIVGITSVLVFGAGTNYALLLIARYREELRRHEDRHVAMAGALRQAGPAVLASSGTVVLALVSLALAVVPGTRSLGYAAAIGIVTAVVWALVFLPAALLLFGRGLFWPFVPRVGQDDPSRTGPWARLGAVVVKRPVVVLLTGVLVLGVLAVGLIGARLGLSQNEQFREEPQAVAGQEALAAAFPAGAAEPTVVLAPTDQVREVAQAAEGVEGVEQVTPGQEIGERTRIDVVLGSEPQSEQSQEAVERLRDALPAEVLVGGPDAEALDDEAAASRDQRLIGPVILLVVLLVLLVLLRSVVAAVVLVGTVVASFVASFGAGWWAFENIFDFPAIDLQVPLFCFLFLVALGVDYNIFLTTRAREEAATAPAKEAITTALAVTGGVITSAGILLAAVFAVLGVLPLIVLTQVGIIVGFGVLLDTLLVRTLLVPAAVTLLGERFWWPGDPAGGRRDRGQGASVAGSTSKPRRMRVGRRRAPGSRRRSG